MANESFERLRRLLDELFQFDRADLDFGIYRIMNQRRDEVRNFLSSDLLPEVRQALATYRDTERESTQAQMEERVRNARALGLGEDQVANVPAIRELQDKLAHMPDAVALENKIYADLYTFFSRYYKDGDFLSLRRYKPGVYAIPYEGEEVKLHWANADQYYVKSSEAFQDYRFRLPDGRHVHFKLAAATTERDNNKAVDGQERRFVLRTDDPAAEAGGDLHVYFEYRPSGEKQTELNKRAVTRLMELPDAETWREGLSAAAPTQSNPGRTCLEKHMADYTARNSFDYFIHKDLGGFLRRELDFFLKNEVLHLDDLDTDDERRATQYLARLRAVKQVGYKIVDFLAQLEDFQKKLWLKKKFVVRADYCVTLDRVTEELYAEIAANDAQREEWVRLFAINGIEGNLASPGYSEPMTVQFLKSNPQLILDTRFFNTGFGDALLASFDNLDEASDGLLINSDNLQALSLLQSRYASQLQCIYIDPPYNTGGDRFLYKDNYRHSSWLTMMEDRIALGRDLLAESGTILVSADDNEQANLRRLMDDISGRSNFVAQLIWNTEGHTDNQFEIKVNHEYVLLYAKEDSALVLGNVIDPNTREESNLWRGFAENSITKNGPANPPSQVTLPAGFPCAVDSLDLEPSNVGEDFYSAVAQVGYITRDITRRFNVSYPVRIDRMVCREGRLAADCTVFSGWANVNKLKAFIRSNSEAIRDEDGNSLKFYLSDRGVIYYRKERDKAQNIVSVLRNMGTTEQMRSELERMGLVFRYPKPKELLRYLIEIGAQAHSSTVLDYFAGSGTTGHAVINLNREDGGNRKYILVEMGEYFDTVLKPRIQKIIYSKDWRDGKPVSREGSSHMFKYLTLESYEDTLNNLEVNRPKAMQRAFDEAPEAREDYMLHYMLDLETRDSASLLNLERFEDPFNYELRISEGGETRSTKVDLVETFNWLLGLRVHKLRVIDGYRTVEGLDPDDEKVLVIWRSLKDDRHSNEGLERFFANQGYGRRSGEEALSKIYVNGDNTLTNLRETGSRWDVLLLEEEFRRLMWTRAGEGVL